MKLVGETTGRPGTDETRVPINIDTDVRTRLREFLYLAEMRGVGYSEFISRALDAAEEELTREERNVMFVLVLISDDPYGSEPYTKVIGPFDTAQAAWDHAKVESGWDRIDVNEVNLPEALPERSFGCAT